MSRTLLVRREHFRHSIFLQDIGHLGWVWYCCLAELLGFRIPTPQRYPATLVARASKLFCQDLCCQLNRTAIFTLVNTYI